METIARGKADIRDELENNTVSIEIKVGLSLGSPSASLTVGDLQNYCQSLQRSRSLGAGDAFL